jgi:hypothetical protein
MRKCDRRGERATSGLSASTRLRVRRQSGAAQIDTVVAHWDAFGKQELTLSRPYGEAPVGANHPMPRDVVVNSRKNEADETRRTWIDVAIRPHEPGRDCAHPADDARGARLVAVGVPANRTARTSPATSSPHG